MKKIITLLAICITGLEVFSQNIGINTTSPQASLDVRGNQRFGGINTFLSYDTASGRFTWTNSHLWVTNPQYLMQHSASAEGLYYGNSQLEYRNSGGAPVFYTNWNNGFGFFSTALGIGTTTPDAPLSFPPYTGKKISLYPGGTGDAGFGVFGNELRINSDYINADITFGYDDYVNGFTERMRVRGNGNVGIGTNSPNAKLHVSNGSILFTGPATLPGTPGPPPATGAGTRMMWYANKAAFRTGNVAATNWDESLIGNNSFASGNDTKASGYTSTAMGQGSEATGDWSVALGYYSLATGVVSRAIGSFAIASGNTSTAIGYGTTASGAVSTAMGGNVSTNSHAGAFIIGDNSRPSYVLSSADHEMMMVFNGGYKLYSNSAATLGVQLLSGSNAWSVISDENRKENYYSADGEDFLNKIKRFRLGSWNYKGQDPQQNRHYGPMAQEFFDAFGKDIFGTIGNDTTINQADFDGINLIAIQALEKRTHELQTAITALKELKTETKKKDEELLEIKRSVEFLMKSKIESR
jgi:Chaperone of endosialidase/Head domain of trimeric autotransporter adhesin